MILLMILPEKLFIYAMKRRGIFGPPRQCLLVQGSLTLPGMGLVTVYLSIMREALSQN